MEQHYMGKQLIGNVGKFGIGQRCFLLETAAGNVLWDMISLLDDPTIDFVCPPSSSSHR